MAFAKVSLVIDPALEKVRRKYFDGLASAKTISRADARTACDAANRMELWRFPSSLKETNSGHLFFVMLKESAESMLSDSQDLGTYPRSSDQRGCAFAEGAVIQHFNTPLLHHSGFSYSSTSEDRQSVFIGFASDRSSWCSLCSCFSMKTSGRR